MDKCYRLKETTHATAIALRATLTQRQQEKFNPVEHKKVMSSIITGILRSTVGLLFDKARGSAAIKLKDGDLADEKLREIIVKDLSDIKSKLDCLSLKDLDASYSFLKEGVELLKLALDKLNDSLQQLNRVIVDRRLCLGNFAVNTCGDIVLLTNTKITVICSTGESKEVRFPADKPESNVAELYSMSIAVDSSDNVYALRWRKTCDKDGNVKSDHVLYVFDEKYNIKLVPVLDFLKEKYQDVKIDVNKNQNLIMSTYDRVYVTDNKGKLISQFKRDEDRLRSLNISNNNDIMIATDDRSAVKIYSTEGNLKSAIKVPEDHKVREVAFHHDIGKIIVLTWVRKLHSLFLLGYSETGELENSVFLTTCLLQARLHVKSHLNGVVAINVNECITLI